MIKAQNLTKRYGQHIAIDSLNFTIERGEIVGFLGPNGAGKSTTMNILTGYLSATEGSISVDGMDVLEHPEEVKRKIGYMPESPPLYLDMTVTDFLHFVGEIKRVPKAGRKEALDRILELVGITDVQKRLIKNLSKGYKQRVGLAQALIGNPEVLILDEPTVGLDPRQIIEIRNLIKSLGKEHTIVLSSHILPEVSAVCERVLIINRGVIVANGTPENLARGLAGKNRITIRVAGGGKAVENALKQIDGLIEMDIQRSSEEEAVDVLLEAKAERDIRRDVFHVLSKADLPILQMRPMDMTLEDIFLRLITSEKEA